MTECKICPEEYYSFNIKECYNCANGAVCKGGSNVFVNKGYWRKHRFSENVLECKNLLENCVGGPFGNFVCYEGHVGPLCESCDVIFYT